jgi:hypothetical protein
LIGVEVLIRKKMDALEGQRKSGRLLLSWRHPIAQDIKFFGYQSV